MASQIPEEIHIRHFMLLEFHKDSNATVDTKNICDVYPRRPTTLDNDVIKGASGCKSMSDNRGTVKCSYNQPWLTIQDHLRQIGKTNRADEKWVLYVNPKRRRQWFSPKEPPRTTAKPGLHPKEALLCGICGIIHFEVLKPGETVNADLYCEQLDQLNQSLIEKYPAIISIEKALFCKTIMQDRTAKEKHWKKLMDWGGRYCLTDHTRLTLR
ncbi:histone-lysine N-methyltransferase SETMAR [Trichonephila clavipes]|nr:histone-lysine N-methyltransferase SETMAR [Trichonephila clavipes]